MGSTTSITMNRLRLFSQTIKILNTNSLNSNTITLLPCSFNKTIAFTTNIVNNRTVFDQSITICDTNSLHFLTLSFFFLPFTIATMAAIQLDLSSADVTSFKILTTFIAVISFVIFSAISGVALITYSTYHTISFRTPLTLASTFKSLSHSFIPLLSTFIAATIKLAFISLVIILLGLGFQFDKIRISCVLVITVLFYVAAWGFAPVIAVLESKSGFVSLRESVKNQSGLHRLKFFSMVIGRGFVIWSSLCYCDFLKNQESVSIWLLFLLVSVIHLHLSSIIMHYVVTTTVLYVRAKAARGGDVVVKTTMHVSEDMRVRMLGGWFIMVGIFQLIIVMSYSMFF